MADPLTVRAAAAAAAAENATVLHMHFPGTSRWWGLRWLVPPSKFMETGIVLGAAVLELYFKAVFKVVHGLGAVGGARCQEDAGTIGRVPEFSS
jgi:hypothetical protein